jgi:RimJ/RimL family protein N-acetyltransferase
MKLSLRLAEKSDIAQLMKWSLAPDFMHYFGNLAPESLAKQKEEWIRRIAIQQLAFSPRQTLMVVNEDLKEIGFITLANIDWRNRHCAYEIYLDEKYRDQQLGIQASAHAFKYIFYELNLNKMFSYIIATNEGALNIQKTLTLKPEIIFEKQYSLNGKLFDVHVYGYQKEAMIEEIKKVLG